MNFWVLHTTPLKEVLFPKLCMHMVKGTNGGTGLAYLVLVPKLLPTSCDWPRGFLPEALLSYGVISPSDLEFERIAPHMTNLLEVAQGWV